ncbi:MAG: hypothetical protein ABI904_11885 [Chloroflexota bacterium]
MPRIKCHYVDCVFLDDGYCSAAAVEIDPDSGCATFSPSDAAAGAWEAEEETEWEDEESEEGEDDLWEDDEEDEF